MRAMSRDAVTVGRAHRPHTRAFAVIHGECFKSETAWRRGMDSNFRYRGWKVLNLFPYERSCAHPPVWSFFQRPHTLLQPVDAMLPRKQMILPLVVCDRKKAEPIFLDGVGPPRLGISGPREGRLAEPLPHRIYLCCPRVCGRSAEKTWRSPECERRGFVGRDRCQPLQLSPDGAHALPRGGEYHLTMIQKGSKVGGFYECRRGTMSCRNLDDSGGIENGAVRESSVLFRVMCPTGRAAFSTVGPRATEWRELHLPAGFGVCGARSVGSAAELLA
jgi:hypothetical protein